MPSVVVVASLTVTFNDVFAEAKSPETASIASERDVSAAARASDSAFSFVSKSDVSPPAASFVNVPAGSMTYASA